LLTRGDREGAPVPLLLPDCDGLPVTLFERSADADALREVVPAPDADELVE